MWTANVKKTIIQQHDNTTTKSTNYVKEFYLKPNSSEKRKILENAGHLLQQFNTEYEYPFNIGVSISPGSNFYKYFNSF